MSESNMKIACIKNNTVVAMVDVEESEIAALAASNDAIVDCSNILPVPQVGWKLVGNALTPTEPVALQIILEQKVASAIVNGKKIKDEVTAKIGAKNLILGKTEAEISALVSSLISIGFLLEGGALVTARTALNQAAAGFPEYADEFSYAVLRINQAIG